MQIKKGTGLICKIHTYKDFKHEGFIQTLAHLSVINHLYDIVQLLIFERSHTRVSSTR